MINLGQRFTRVYSWDDIFTYLFFIWCHIELNSRTHTFSDIPYNGKFSRHQIFAVWSKKTWGLFFAGFNFRGLQRPRKIISILFRKNRRVVGTTGLSLDRSTGKENGRPKYLKLKGIKDTCNHFSIFLSLDTFSILYWRSLVDRHSYLVV